MPWESLKIQLVRAREILEDTGTNVMDLMIAYVMERGNDEEA